MKNSIEFSTLKIRSNAHMLLIVCMISGCQSALAQEDKITEWVRTAREAEARGDYNDAGQQYYSLLKNEFNYQMSPGIKDAVGRRAVACLTIAARQGMQNGDPYEGWSHCEALNVLEQTWREMQKLEPNSPTWPYLMATRECSQGRYADARNHLQQSIRTTGGQASVRKKAQLLMNHIAAFANTDFARLQASDKAAVQALLSGRFATNMSSQDNVSSSSSGGWQPDTISDSERRARNAENAGDSGAAARFRSGGTTVQDSSRYW